MRVLWLASWYPNKLFPLNGDFVQRHAQAAALYNQIDVLHVCRDEKAMVTTNTKQETNQQYNLTEKIIYYHSFTTGIKFIDRIFSTIKYRKLYKKAIEEYIAANGKPALVHIHITMNAGLMALWLKKKYGIEYVITEHWSGLLPEAKNSFYQQPVSFKLLWKKIISGAKGLSTVSDYLGKTIAANIIQKGYTVIPNVVNTILFKPVIKPENIIPTFIHISRLDYQKNPEAVFKAFYLLSQSYNNFKLILFSNETDVVKQFANQYNLTGYIEHYEETVQEDLVKKVQLADALVLFSRYETFGCVVAEANACGLPVIVSDIAVMHELVSENINGLFAANESAEALAEKLLWFIQHKQHFHSSQIAELTAAKYNYKQVGQLFNDWYSQILRS